MSSGGRWALTGREDEIRDALDVLARPGPVVGLALVGEVGVGKTRLADELVARASSGREVHRIVGTPSAESIPFAACSHLLTSGGGPPRGRLEPPDLLWAMRTVRDALGGGGVERVLVVVDDAHDLDEASATVVHQVAVSGEAAVLLTARTGTALPAPIGAVLAHEACTSMTIGPLGRDDVGRLVAAETGAWMEQASLARVHAATGGNPLFVRELLADAVAEGRLSTHRGLLRWAGVGPGARLTVLVARDLGRLDDPSTALVDALAVGAPLPLAVVRELASVDAVAALERRGVVRADETPDGVRVRLGHPLFGEVRRASLGPAGSGAVAAGLAQAFRRAGCDGPDDAYRVVCWRVDAGEQVVAAELVDAAAHARRVGDDDRALQLLRLAGGTSALPSVALGLAELAERAGRLHEAAELCEGLVPRLTDDRDRARALTVQMRVLVHGLGDVGGAERAAATASTIDDPIWRGFTDAQWATLLAMLGRLDEAGDLGRALFAHADPRVRLRALPAVNLSAYAAGHLEEALAAAESLVGPALAHRDEVPVGVTVVFSALALDLLALGRLDDVDRLLALADDASATPGANQAFLRLVDGTLALRRGRVDLARRALAESVSAFGESDPQGYRPAALALLAQAAAAGGDRAEAVAAADEATALMRGRVRRLIDVDSRRALAWVAVVDGDVRAARRQLVDLARVARADGLHLFEADCLHDAVRLGAGRRTQARLVDVAAVVDGERAAAIAAHAAALSADDGRALGRVADRFAELGELLVAAEVGAAAARHLAAAGLDAAAARTSARAAGFAARCSGAVLPHQSTAPRAALSPRELQVARLAALGRASRDIAEELCVSPRTVDNQLSRVYTKLGISGRGELAQALGAVEVE